MIEVQEVSQSNFHPINELPRNVQNALKKGNCIKCKQPISNGRIHYLTANKIIWWHDMGCS